MPLNYKLLSNESIYDALVKIQVPFENIVSVLQDNDYNLDDDLSSEHLIYEQTQVVQSKGGQIVIKPLSGISYYQTNATQNIFDVCLMTLGDINKIILFISENADTFNSINGLVGGVKTVNYNDIDVTDNGFKLAVKKSNINFTTGDLANVDLNLLLQENGYFIELENGNYLLY